MKIRIWIAALLLTTGCAGSPPETTYFLLRANDSAAASMPEGDVGLGMIEVAMYIDQPGIVVETKPNQLRVARNNLWAEPLQKGLRSTLAGQLSKALGAHVQQDPLRAKHWRLKIDVKIDQLHGTHDGRALMVASWRITDVANDETAATGRFEQSETLADSGYPALVASELALVEALAKDIARATPSASGD